MKRNPSQLLPEGLPMQHLVHLGTLSSLSGTFPKRFEFSRLADVWIAPRTFPYSHHNLRQVTVWEAF